MEKEILGQEQVEKQLAKSIRDEKVYPTLIFCGPAGVGKSTMAHKFAKCLLAEKIPQGDDLSVAEYHPIHKSVEMHTHPDFFVLDQSAISIEDTRKLMANLRTMPAQSKWRVVILENAENLNKSTCNSLLKILEEPPKNSVIVMICTHVGNMPKTLLSRAYVVNFYPIADKVVQNFLEKRGIQDAEQLAKISDGSIGYALKLAENNGLEIYEHLLAGIMGDAANYAETVKYVMTKNICGNFDMVKNSLMHILRNYMNELIRCTGNTCSPKIDAMAKKILEISFLLNRCDFLQLDKNAVVASIYEKFHKK